MQTKHETKRMVILALMSGILLVMSFTPLGYLHVGALEISLNMIPVAIAAAAAGPSGGAFLGAVFGVTSFLQCIGIGGTSYMGMILFEISPIMTIILCMIPRILAGLLSGCIYLGIKKGKGSAAAPYVTGFSAALLNTILFMLALIMLFGSTEYLQSLIAGRNILLFICAFVGVNALVEMLAATIIVGAICRALEKTKLIGGT